MERAGKDADQRSSALPGLIRCHPRLYYDPKSSYTPALTAGDPLKGIVPVGRLLSTRTPRGVSRGRLHYRAHRRHLGAYGASGVTALEFCGCEWGQSDIGAPGLGGGSDRRCPADRSGDPKQDRDPGAVTTPPDTPRPAKPRILLRSYTRFGERWGTRGRPSGADGSDRRRPTHQRRHPRLVGDKTLR